jgi:DNA-binding MarR family transcriptional regulator
LNGDLRANVATVTDPEPNRREQVFSAELRAFVKANIDSIDQLEALRILGNDPAREWKPADLAAELQIDGTAMVAHLAIAESRGLVMSHPHPDGASFRFAARTPEIATLIQALLRLYEQRPVSLIRLVYERTPGD